MERTLVVDVAAPRAIIPAEFPKIVFPVKEVLPSIVQFVLAKSKFKS